MTTKDGLLTFKFVDCNKTYEKKFDEDLPKRLKNTCQFCDRDIDKFCLMFWKGAYPYGYIDGWKCFNETLLSTKKEFYSNLSIESITDADYKTYQKSLERLWITKSWPISQSACTE